jgi:ABC-type protease/lipase transport system fused ATPase/permease subunit
MFFKIKLITPDGEIIFQIVDLILCEEMKAQFIVDIPSNPIYIFVWFLFLTKLNMLKIAFYIVVLSICLSCTLFKISII